MTIEQAIAQVIGLGEKDPLAIARKVIKDNDKHWLANELTALAEDVIADIARRRLSSSRRSAEVAIRPGNAVSVSELKLRSIWIPGDGWVAMKNATAQQIRARAAWESRLVAMIQRRVEWYLEVADLMEREGAATFGKFRGELPALPDADLPEVEAA